MCVNGSCGQAGAKSNTSIEHHLLISRVTIKEILLEYDRRGIP